MINDIDLAECQCQLQQEATVKGGKARTYELINLTQKSAASNKK
jgi:hypothetical protein